MSCKNQEYTITKGDVLLFKPGDSHACVQNDGGTLDYRGFNITKGVMLGLVEEVTGKRELPGLAPSIYQDIFKDTGGCHMKGRSTVGRFSVLLTIII